MLLLIASLMKRFDYMFHTAETLNLVGVRRLKEGGGITPMPNAEDASDHHYLAAEYELK